ncbi:uncharacterized protein LOC126387170 [Epinephelus moara]|uniref:uncharacterized protein LOC126387170 n=1 Tax=Epinephelus moara TaxID=300413 RepID=UPI00214E9468|nr:uncharacterized protein LOC126387170 [Epinephelus moara]
MYIAHALAFVDYLGDTPPHHCRVPKRKVCFLQRELKKILKIEGRTVLGHQQTIRQVKQQRLVTRQSLSTCQSLARAKIPELLDDIERGSPRDPKTRYRFFGYFGAYISSIYGHRTGVLTSLKVKEVKEALGDEEAGYLINVQDHKTLRKFGKAQVYLDKVEYGWCKKWLDLRKRTVATNLYFFTSFGKGQAKDMVRYIRMAWAEMGLPGSPTVLDIRSVVATYNFEQNSAEARAEVAKFMCHSVATQERFYALHKSVALAGKMRQLFVWAAVDDGKPSAAPSTSAAAPSSSSSSSAAAAPPSPSSAAAAPSMSSPSPKRSLSMVVAGASGSGC